MNLNWRRLTAIPHHPHGRPDLYALREAMLLRAKLADSAFNRIKTGRKMGIEGPARARLLSKDSQEALLSLSLVSLTALTLADQRQRRGITPMLGGGGGAGGGHGNGGGPGGNGGGPDGPDNPLGPPPDQPGTSPPSADDVPLAVPAVACSGPAPAQATIVECRPDPDVVIHRKGHLTLLAGGG